MKRLFALFLTLACLLALTACGETEVDGIPSLDLVAQESAEWAAEKLAGYTQDDIQKEWDEPDGTLSGFYGEYWNLENAKRVVVTYDGDGNVMEVAINEVETTAGTTKPTAPYPTTTDDPLPEDALMTDTAKALGITAENYPRIDGSTSTLNIVKAIHRAMYEEGTAEYEKMYSLEASKTVPSYHKLIDGEVDLIFVPYASEDVLKAAEDAGVELVFTKVAAEALIFVTPKENTTEGVTREQIRSIYLDYGITNWSELGGPDRELVPICRNADSGSQSQMDNLVLENEPMHPDIQENYVELTMEGLLELVAFYHNGGFDSKPTNSYAIGYTLYTYLQNMTEMTGIGDSLKILSYDGVVPSAENIADGSYSLSDGYYAVIRADLPDGHSARAVIDWLRGVEGQDAIKDLGLIPIGIN